MVRKPSLIDDSWENISDVANSNGLRTASGLKWSKARMRGYANALERNIYEISARLIGSKPRLRVQVSGRKIAA